MEHLHASGARRGDEDPRAVWVRCDVAKRFRRSDARNDCVTRNVDDDHFVAAGQGNVRALAVGKKGNIPRTTTDVDGREQDGASDLNELALIALVGKRIQPSSMRSEGDTVGPPSVHRSALRG